MRRLSAIALTGFVFSLSTAQTSAQWTAYNDVIYSSTATADTSGHAVNGTIVNAAWAVGSPFDANVPPDQPVLVAPADGSQTTDMSMPLTVHVSDYEADPLQVKFYGRKLSGTPRPPFSIVAVPDTQFYSESYPATFANQTQWIVNNRQNLSIAYVGHEGDIVNVASTNQQWVNANNAISIFDTVPELPFGLCIGNHDEGPSGGTGYFNTWFPYSRYEGRSWYGGHYGTNNDNHYILFRAGGMDFIAIHIKYDTSGSPATLSWVGGLLQTHSSRRAILVTHSLLEVTAAWTTQGAIVYNALKGYPNLFLMLCGHNHGENRRIDVYQNNSLYTLLADYQNRTNGGEGWLRILQFVPDDNQISVRTYSTTLNQYERDADSEFALAYDMGGAAYVELGTVAASSNSDASITWTNLEPQRVFEWYATVSDGHTTVTGPAWSFFVNRPPGPEIGLNATKIERTVHIFDNLTDDTFTVANVGVDTMNYTISDDADWLSVQPASGDSSGELDPIRIVYDVAGLPVGPHTAKITVASDGAWNTPQKITVTVHVATVKPDFDLDGDVDQADFGHLQGCLTGPSVFQTGQNCTNADLDGDKDVDSIDIGKLRGCMRGPDTPTDPNCAN